MESRKNLSKASSKTSAAPKESAVRTETYQATGGSRAGRRAAVAAVAISKGKKK